MVHESQRIESLDHRIFSAKKLQQKKKVKREKEWEPESVWIVSDIERKASQQSIQEFDQYVIEEQLACPSPEDDPETGLRCNKKLAAAIGDDFWLTNDMVDEFLQHMIVDKNKQDQVCFVPSSYVILVNDEKISKSIVAHLVEFEAHKKNIFLMPLTQVSLANTGSLVSSFPIKN